MVNADQNQDQTNILSGDVKMLTEREKELKQKMLNARFTKKQLKVVREFAIYKIEQYKKENESQNCILERRQNEQM